MKEITITIDNREPDQALAEAIGRRLAERDNPESMVIAWPNRPNNACSP